MACSLPVTGIPGMTMSAREKNILTLKGEILEILDLKDSQKIRIICKPDWIILELDRTAGYNLKDKIHIKGKMHIMEMHKLDLEKKENSLI